MIRTCLAAAAAVALMTGVAVAQTQTTTTNSTVTTSQDSAVVTGHVGSTATTMMPGVAGQGMLMGNGNGTSTLLTPGGPPQVIATPR